MPLPRKTSTKKPAVPSPSSPQASPVATTDAPSPSTSATPVVGGSQTPKQPSAKQLAARARFAERARGNARKVRAEARDPVAAAYNAKDQHDREEALSFLGESVAPAPMTLAALDFNELPPTVRDALRARHK